MLHSKVVQDQFSKLNSIYIFPVSRTGVYEHVLLQVLNACESDSAGRTLEGPVGAVGAGPG